MAGEKMSAEQLAEGEALAAKATPGPWRLEHDWTMELTGSDGHIIGKWPTRAAPGDKPDLAFIVWMRNNLPSLLATAREVEGLREELAGANDKAAHAQQESATACGRMREQKAELRAKLAASEAECERLRTFGAKANAIRDSIVGAQTVSWSEHVYPLVAALNEAGFEGMPYDDASRRRAVRAACRGSLALSLLDLYLERQEEAERERDEAREARVFVLVGWSKSEGVFLVQRHDTHSDAFRAGRAFVKTDKGHGQWIEAPYEPKHCFWNKGCDANLEIHEVARAALAGKEKR